MKRSLFTILILGGIVGTTAPRQEKTLPPSPWLKGYAKTISGETIGYHSPYPDAGSALLVRATDGRMSIAWETEPVPAGFAAESATFFWMCGLATGKGAHRFTLEVDGTPRLDFRTGKDDSERTWEIQGSDGVSLSFQTTMVDQFRELFGFMFLRLPRALFTPGSPVRLKVNGENAGSPDWFIVFQYDLAPWFRAGEERALVRKDGRLSQLVKVEVSRIGPPAMAVFSIAGGERVEASLRMGYTALTLAVDAVKAETDAEVRVDIDGRPAYRQPVRLRPVPRREFWLLPHSHTDIGYSDPQEVVERKHRAYIEQAIEIARRTASFPAGARFKWNSEVLWAVESYLRQASPEKRAAFFDAVKRGWIGLDGLFANVLTGLCHPEELFHVLAYARRLAAEEGVRVDTAMITDIPSYSWSLVPALAQSGIRYLSSGPNYMPKLADGGDRIGGALKAWGDKPFYWVGPSGTERVLFWMAGRGYSWFHGLNRGAIDIDKAGPLLDYCRELAEAEYPYDMVQVRYTIGGDNGPPDPDLPDAVKAWNEVFESPKFVIATTREMFEEFERRHGAKIPLVRSDFSPYWEDGAASTASETAANRESANRLLLAESLWAMFEPTRFPAAEFDQAWRQVVLWSEHTWGAADSISAPDGENARRQWEHKKSFALEAERRSLDLLGGVASAWVGGAGGAGIPARSYGNAVDIVNPTGYSRNEVVLVPKLWSASGDLVSDEKGVAIPSQRLSTGELAVLAGPIPAFGVRRFIIRKGAPHVRAAVQSAGLVLENNFIKATLDEATGAVSSLIWKAGDGRELVDREAGKGLNEYFYVPGRDPRQARGVTAVAIRPGEMGPLVASLIVESKAPGAKSLRREIRLNAASDRLECFDLIDKSKVREKESVHIGFPFLVPDGEVRIDLGWGFLRPGVNQIAGSNRDFFCLHNAADVSNGEYGVTWMSLDAPLVEVGEMTDERIVERGGRKWRTSVPASRRLFAYVMNNYWHTNYKADQEGPVELRFFMRPHFRLNPADVVRWGIEAVRPFVVLPATASGPLWSGPGLEAQPTSVVVVSLKPSRDGRALIARLYNPSDQPTDTILTGRLAQAGTIYRSSPFENRGEAVAGPILMMPYETLAVRIELR